MQRFPILLICIAFSCSVYGQSLKKYEVGASGCSTYFFCDPGTFDVSKSPDSSDVFTGECANAGVNYGIICVRLKEKADDLNTGEGMLISYLDYLKGALNIVSAAGYGKGHRLKNREDTRGVIDYWTDKDKLSWKVKAWTDGKYIVVMYTSSKSELPETKINVFLDGLVLPGS